MHDHGLDQWSSKSWQLRCSLRQKLGKPSLKRALERKFKPSKKVEPRYVAAILLTPVGQDMGNSLWTD